jgi:spermidine synthase
MEQTLYFLFFLSGASSLIFETIFTRLLTYTYGNTAYAVSTVLAAFLGGLALGALLLGRWVDRRPPSLWIYGGLELLVGIYCLFIPKLFGLMTGAYITLFHRLQLGTAGLTAIRFGLAALVILLPTMLMGGTLPALARYVSAGCADFQVEVDRLYAWNTFGAALGTLASTFLLIPTCGVTWTIRIACAINFVIFASVFSLRKHPLEAPPIVPTLARDHFPTEGATASRATAVLLIGSFFTGAVALGYEVLWTHALSFTVGNTVYAFGTMLFAMLCGLGWGARIVSHYFSRPEVWARALAASQGAVGLAVFLTVRLWDRVPDFFALGLGRAAPIGMAFLVGLRITIVMWRNRHRPQPTAFRWLRVNEPLIDGLLLCALALGSDWLWKHDATYFVAAELARFSCAFFLLIGPAVLLGLSFPLLLNLYSREMRHAGSSVGGIYAANTVGAILGSVSTGFLLLPRLGSLATLRLAATLNLILAVCFGFFLVPSKPTRRLLLAIGTATTALLLWIAPGHWDARRMSCGSYVYFRGGSFDRVLYHREDVQGGSTSVVQVGSVKVLLSNGKFQGNDGGEVRAQIRFALVPVLFTREFRRAMVIGLGTGNTLRTISHFPFQRIDVAELAPAIVEAARDYFEDVNGRVFDRDPRVHVSIADGRNFLLLSRDTYDLITIEITSIWIAGEADLYNKEFYQLCRARLGEHGVLQQWVQIHHMRTQDLLVILNTAAQVFPHVAFFQGPEQGLLIASASPLECDYPQIERHDADPQVRQDLAAIGVPSMISLLGELMVYGDSLHQALSQLPALSGRPADFASTDFYPYLEYQTPKSNVLPYDTASLNLDFLRRLRPPLLPSDLIIDNLPSQTERNLVLGYITEQRGDIDLAVDYFRRVEGPSASRAKSEIERIQAKSSGHASKGVGKSSG